jgi:hypothetical protein
MNIIGDFILGCFIVIVGAALIAAQFAYTIDNALEKHKKENENENEN